MLGYWYMFVGIPICLYLALRLVKATAGGRYVLDWLWLHLPLVSGIVEALRHGVLLLAGQFEGVLTDLGVEPIACEPGTEFEVLGMQRGVFECHPANLAVASGRYFPSKLKTSRR